MTILRSLVGSQRSAIRLSKIKRLVDERFYLSCYPDVANAKVNPSRHYAVSGWREGRNPSASFNTLWLLQTVPGSAKSGTDPLSYLVSIGRPVDQTTSPAKDVNIDWMRAAANNDLIPKEARVYASAYALIKASRLLSQNYYRSKYNIEIGDPLEHFIRFGWKLGFNPSPEFNTAWYLEKNPDVVLANLNPLVHYISYGAQEGRRPRPHWDLAAFEHLSRKKRKYHKVQRSYVSRDDYAQFLRENGASIDDRIANIERQLGRRLSEASPIASRALQAFDPVDQGQKIEQYFIAPVDTLYSLNMYFFTYCQPNGATIRITLFGLTDSVAGGTLLHEELIEPQRIFDGQSFSLWPDTPLDVKGAILKLVVKVVSIKNGYQFTIAGRHPNYKAMTVPNLSNNDDVVFALDFNQAPPRESYKTFAFISGCPGDAFRYRCEHQAESLENCGYSTDVFQPHDFPYDQLLHNYLIVVAHRVPVDDSFRNFVRRAREGGVLIVYDVDDLVFDPARVDHIDAYNRLPEKEKELYLDGVRRYHGAMACCPCVSVSTEKLRDVVKEIFPRKHVFVTRNKVSQTMVESAALITQSRMETKRKNVNIAYFSGSKTHDKDFSVCVNPLLFVLKRYSNIKIMIVGHLTPPAEFGNFLDRLEKISFMPWADLPKIYRETDINLAPLEFDSEFTESKSELKFLEAALLSVPTIACDLGAFKISIRNNVNGIVCKDEEQWRNALASLIDDRNRRLELGQNAFKSVMEKSTTYSEPEIVCKRWREVCVAHSTRSPVRKLSVAFVTRAPIAGTGGGYKKIFILAKYLSDAGYDVRVYVEAIAHLSHMTDEEIAKFCHEHFDVNPEMIVVGHNRIERADIAIATNWPTVNVVSKLYSVRSKMYFIQDYEPDFYPYASQEYRAAEKTYDERLAFVTIGGYLSLRLRDRRKLIRSIPFSVDRKFIEAGRRRNWQESRADKRCVILFFARPGIERRNFKRGVQALDAIYKKYGNRVHIKLYGLDKLFDLPFPYDDLGQVSQGELANEMLNIDIHLSFSLTNISTVIYEAMACGCACVEADVPSVQAMVRSGEDCLLGDPDEGAFVAIDKLVQDVDLRRRISREGYLFAQQLTEKNMCEAFENCIRDSSLAFFLHGRAGG